MTCAIADDGKLGALHPQIDKNYLHFSENIELIDIKMPLISQNPLCFLEESPPFASVQATERAKPGIGFSIGRRLAAGTGYPCGKKGKDIPPEARIMAVADVYDAISEKRWMRRTFFGNCK